MAVRRKSNSQKIGICTRHNPNAQCASVAVISALYSSKACLIISALAGLLTRYGLWHLPTKVDLQWLFALAFCCNLQQRVCSGFAPDSLLIPRPAAQKPNALQYVQSSIVPPNDAAKIRKLVESEKLKVYKVCKKCVKLKGSVLGEFIAPP